MGEDGPPLLPAPDRETLQRAVDTWGEPLQVALAIEECSELTAELARVHRRSGGEEHVVEEIADVWIMCHQLALIYGEEQVAAEVDRKMNRLTDRLETTEWMEE